jgi:hypothetical protein
VSYQGTPVAVLPAIFYSSELLGLSVAIPTPGDYTFTAVAPDGSTTAPLPVTVQPGAPAAAFGLTPPDVQLVFPPSLDTSFTGTVWLVGDGFAPGCVVTASVPGLPPVVAPALYLNQRTVGWVAATPVAGTVTLQVTNPTLLTSQTFTLTVGTPPAGPSGAPAPHLMAPPDVTSPFLGSVHLLGQGIAVGATAELRPAGATAATASASLVRMSSSEAWWMLVYPQPGSYEVRVVNPDGGASPWRAFDVR